MKRGFTLIELLVVIAIISLLIAILMPVLSRAREQASIVVVNAELYDIGIALESYSMDNENKYPPTRGDCESPKHAYALPQELVDSGCLPKGQIGRVRFAKIDDKFNRGCTYKYIAVGPRYNYLGTPFGVQPLYIPKGFLYFGKDNFVKPDPKKDRYDNAVESPVTWVLFSAGPRYDKQRFDNGNFPLKNGFPVLKYFWYSPDARKGIITRMRLKKGQHIGSFERQ